MATVQRGATNALDLRSFVHMKQHQETKLLLVKKHGIYSVYGHIVASVSHWERGSDYY